MTTVRSPWRYLSMAVVAVALAVVLFTAGSFGLRNDEANVAAPTPTLVENATRPFARVPGASLATTIDSLRARLVDAPNDYVSWATLGIAYVQQAKVLVDPTYYPQADGALAESLKVGPDDNFLAYAGLSALASARHDFSTAKDFAEQGLAINEYNSILYGALSDAQIQLGLYDDGFASVQRMVDLRPGTASLTRASYTWELRGDVEQATALMQRALDDASSPSDRAFASFYLGELSFNEGDAGGALEHFNAAIAAAPDEPALLAGKARAEAATGQVLTAIDHYADVVTRVPDPAYLIEYGRLLESLGRDAEAQRQYDVVDATIALFRAQGVAPDAGPVLFTAQHGDIDEALAQAEQGVAQRPFVAMYDAQAWALHLAGRDDEALVASQQALQLGTRYASYHFHAGMIQLALGNDDEARAELTMALDINPTFDPLDVPIATDALAGLGGGA